MSKNPTLERLKNSSSIRNSGYVNIGRAKLNRDDVRLVMHRQLTSLHFAPGVTFSPGAIELFLSELLNRRTLTSLGVCDFPQYSRPHHLAFLAPVASTLTTLKVFDIGLDTVHTKLLCRGLRQNTRLKKLTVLISNYYHKVRELHPIYAMDQLLLCLPESLTELNMNVPGNNYPADFELLRRAHSDRKGKMPPLESLYLRYSRDYAPMKMLLSYLFARSYFDEPVKIYLSGGLKKKKFSPLDTYLQPLYGSYMNYL